MPRAGLRSSPPVDQAFVPNRDSMQAAELALWLPMIGQRSPAPLDLARGRTTGKTGAPLAGQFADGYGVGNGTYNTDYYTVAAGTKILTNASAGLSFTCWVTLTAYTASSDAAAVQITDAGGNNAAALWFNMFSNQIEFRSLNSGFGQTLAIKSGAPAAGLYHLAGVRETGGLALYVNGVLAQGGVAYTFGGNASIDALRFGSGAVAVHDVRAYGRVLSAQDVWQQYAPQTRWDLYRPAKWRTLVQGAAGTPTPIIGTGAVTIGHPTLAGTGTEGTPTAITGSGAITIHHLTLTGSGISGSGGGSSSTNTADLLLLGIL